MILSVFDNILSEKTNQRTLKTHTFANRKTLIAYWNFNIYTQRNNLVITKDSILSVKFCYSQRGGREVATLF